MPEPTLNSKIGLYRSGVTSPERLRHTSVAREHVLDNSVESLRGSVGRKSKHPLLFIGPRGIGKTHLLDCIEDTVQSDETLSASYVVVRFPEESNRTLSFADFLIGLCEIPERCRRRRAAMGGVVLQGTDRGRQRPGCRQPLCPQSANRIASVVAHCSLCSRTWARYLRGKFATKTNSPRCVSSSWPTTAACCWPPRRYTSTPSPMLDSRFTISSTLRFSRT